MDCPVDGVDRLLRRLTPAPPERVRAVRAIEVLEQVETPEARLLLQTLAGGAPEAVVTREARASLERLTRRAAAGP